MIKTRLLIATASAASCLASPLSAAIVASLSGNNVPNANVIEAPNTITTLPSSPPSSSPGRTESQRTASSK